MALEASIDAGVKLTFGGVHHELDHLALGDAGAPGKLRRGRITWARGIVAVDCSGCPRRKIREFRHFSDIRGG
jgi:hypothetical protein